MSSASEHPKDPPTAETTEIIANVTEFETRIAIIEEGRLMELLVERPEKERMVGDIYKGKVKAVLPGIQAAFIDIGLERTAFLHISDVGYSDLLYDAEYEESNGDAFRLDRSKSRAYSIDRILEKGQDVLIQIIKEPIGDKGPKVTTEISLAGRYLVLVPGSSHVGVSKKISNWSEKRRLKKLASQLRPDGFGLIVRTVGEGREEKDLEADIKMLTRLWEKLRRRTERIQGPAIVHRDMEMTSSIVRDLLSPDVSRVLIDSKREWRKLRSYVKAVAPNLVPKVVYYSEAVPIFDRFGIEKEIESMLDRKVWIKRGAYIVIDQTEAFVTIDVNTGRFIGKRNQEQTTLITNLEAVREISRQIRLRDIGGIILIDFIDMAEPANRRRVYEEFKKELRKDRSKTFIYPVSELGIIQMTRERTKPSLMQAFSQPCPHCQGIGRVLSSESVAVKIERWFKRAVVRGSARQFVLQVNPSVADILLDREVNRIAKLTKDLKVRIDVIRDTSLHTEQYKVIDLKSGADITQKFMP